MPELPEVETVRAGLEALLGTGAVIDRVDLRRQDLRAPIPTDFPTVLAGQPILGLRRRAKYLIIDTPAAGLLCHLGMTGSWRIAPAGDERDHDHCYLHLRDGRRLAYRDPRRFGLLDLVRDGRHLGLEGLGPEPLERDFTSAGLLDWCRRRRRSAIKAVIMDQAVVVGVGNIYAAEALFRAGVRPTRPAGRLRPSEAQALVAAIRAVLRAAIKAGGSTISDFRQAGGGDGYFQHRFKVYGREGEPCLACATTLRHRVIAGRASVWCPTCQG